MTTTPKKPSKKHIQTRRSISVSREGYDKIKAYCDARSVSMSSVVNKLVATALPAVEAAAPIVKVAVEVKAPVVHATGPTLDLPTPTFSVTI